MILFPSRFIDRYPIRVSYWIWRLGTALKAYRTIRRLHPADPQIAIQAITYLEKTTQSRKQQVLSQIAAAAEEIRTALKQLASVQTDISTQLQNSMITEVERTATTERLRQLMECTSELKGQLSTLEEQRVKCRETTRPVEELVARLKAQYRSALQIWGIRQGKAVLERSQRTIDGLTITIGELALSTERTIAALHAIDAENRATVLSYDGIKLPPVQAVSRVSV